MKKKILIGVGVLAAGVGVYYGAKEVVLGQWAKIMYPDTMNIYGLGEAPLTGEQRQAVVDRWKKTMRSEYTLFQMLSSLKASTNQQGSAPSA